MDQLRIAIVGAGGMGMNHARNLGHIPEAKLAALCDAAGDRVRELGEEHGVAAFTSVEDLIAAKAADAVVIATPHFAHTDTAIACLDAGLHVLCEKPLAVHKLDAEKMLDAHARNAGAVFAEMLNQRAMGIHRKIRDLATSGELGEIRRVSWTITTWYRTQAYYDSGDWRATWAGEGGGVLVNQVPHQLDLLWWMIDRMPTKVQAFCKLGKYHDIEVEDEVTAYLEFGQGCTGTFVTSTGEAPGINRLEIVAERGTLILEHGRLAFLRNEQEMTAFGRSAQGRFEKMSTWNCEIPVEPLPEEGHLAVLRNFVHAIVHGADLIGPAEEGINQVELANAMLHSSITEKPVYLPLDGSKFKKELDKLIEGSRYHRHAG